MKKSALAYIVSLAMILGLFAGVVTAQDASITNTGPGSENSITVDNDCSSEVNNDTDIDLDLDVDQDADSGETENSDNTTGGDATSGDASNDNDVDVNVNIDNSTGNACNDQPADDGEDQPREEDPDDDGEVVVAVDDDSGAVLGDGVNVELLPDTAGANPLTAVYGTIAGLGAISLVARVGLSLLKI